MADITKFDFSDNLRNNLGLQNVEPPISKVAHYVQPVAEIIKFSNIGKTGVRSTSGTTTPFIAPTDKDFYIHHISVNWVKDALCDCTAILATSTLNGLATNLVRRDFVPLIADAGRETLTLQYPIKVDRGAAININATFTAGTLTFSGIVIGVQI